MPSFNIREAIGRQVPVLISVPHCGTAFPTELKDQYKEDMIAAPDDTDWFVDQLYDFAPSLGMTMITAEYSRWVIDLNRDPESKPLYTDGRIITALCPATDFLGNPIYKDGRTEVDAPEVKRRVALYYRPYHDKLQDLLTDLKAKFGFALLWDCHSIRQYVLTIQKDKFPDLILGSADGKSASETLVDIALQKLKQSTLTVNHNHPFKGGYITRNYGKPAENIHALQLEMTKVNYMDDSETTYSTQRSGIIRRLLASTLTALAESISPR
jgi:N-formylglutamate deformylase